jgi:hypothetical protein
MTPILKINLKDRYTPGQLGLIATIDPLKLNAALAISLKRLLMQWFGKFDRDHPNQMQAPRTHFVGDMARAVNEKFDVHGVTLQITHVGILQKIFGGPIVPREKKLLTIPAIAEAYGHRAGEFPDLKFGYAYNPKLGIQMMALIRTGRTYVKLVKNGKGGKKFVPKGIVEDRTRLGSAVFWLVHKVNQKATPGILPGKQDFEKTIDATLALALKPLGLALH